MTALSPGEDGLIDRFDQPQARSRLGTPWRLVTDRVMGGESLATASWETAAGRPCLRLQGQVSLENNGGFVQLALDLATSGHLDASAWDGIWLVAQGNDQRYNLHLKTRATERPWQSYRATIEVDRQWRCFELPFSGFEPHRIDAGLDVRTLKRLGIVAIGRAFQADVRIAEIGFYRDG